MAAPTKTEDALTGTEASEGRSLWRERAIRILLFGAASVAVVVTAAIIYVLVDGAIGFFTSDAVTVAEFFTTTEWSQSAGQFGVYPLVVGTFLIAGGAILLGGGLGTAAALYLAEFATDRVRAIGKPLIEILAGIPSIVYGFFALLTITPFLQAHLDAAFYNALSPMIVIAVMVLPIVVSLSDDAIRSVPDSLRDASLAMGATGWETSINVVLPAARSGVFASIFLGLARALGETMAVTLAAGAVANASLNPLEAHQTMTAYIAQVATGDIPPGPGVDAAFAVGLLLFVITYTVNWGGQWILDKYGVDYE
jgi:phosphate transport system permease protein